MFGRLALGLALSSALANSAMAAGPLEVSTNFAAPLNPAVDRYTADLATIGVTFGLDNVPPTTVTPVGPQTLQFRLLESDAVRGGFQVLSLDVGGTSFAVPLQAFSPTGTVLGEVTSASGFGSLIGDTDSLFGPNEPPFGGFPTYDVYLSDADTVQLTGIGPMIGDVDHLYFSISSPSGGALFEVSVIPEGGVPEPATWAMLILGVGMIGLAARRRSSGLAAAA